MLTTIACLGLSHREAPVDVREQLAFDRAQLQEAHAWMRARQGNEGSGLVIVSTCNRTEFYGSHVDCEGLRTLVGRLLREVRRPADPVSTWLVARHDAGAIEHLFRLAGGLESMVVGETEIFGQLKTAYAAATDHGVVGKPLHRLFQCAFRAGKRVRSQTEITRGSVSVASTAAELAGQIFGDLSRCTVLLLGAGDTAEKTARALISEGAGHLVVANRTLAHAETLAAALGGVAVPFDGWDKELLKADIVIGAASSPIPVFTVADHQATLNRRGARPLFCIDLAVPRNMEPALSMFDDLYLYNVDDLQQIADRHLAERRAAIAKGEAIIHNHVREFVTWLESLQNGGSTSAFDARRHLA